jgi:hypothetical protein
MGLPCIVCEKFALELCAAVPGCCRQALVCLRLQAAAEACSRYQVGCCDGQTSVFGECCCLACHAWHCQLCSSIFDQWGVEAVLFLQGNLWTFRTVNCGALLGQRAPVSTKEQSM